MVEPENGLMVTFSGYELKPNGEIYTYEIVAILQYPSPI